MMEVADVSVIFGGDGGVIVDDGGVIVNDGGVIVGDGGAIVGDGTSKLIVKPLMFP